VLRAANKLAEAMYRQLVSWTYQRWGYIVIYDRHFLFEAALGGTKGTRVGDRAYYRALTRLYPRPDLTVFLDAPPEVLLQRKGEGTLEVLARRRESYVEEGRRTANFFVVDANRRLNDVVDEVGRHLATLHSERNSTNSTP
jgi:thymidylate kinase